MGYTVYWVGEVWAAERLPVPIVLRDWLDTLEYSRQLEKRIWDAYDYAPGGRLAPTFFSVSHCEHE